MFSALVLKKLTVYQRSLSKFIIKEKGREERDSSDILCKPSLLDWLLRSRQPLGAGSSFYPFVVCVLQAHTHFYGSNSVHVMLIEGDQMSSMWSLSSTMVSQVWLP